MAVPDMTKDGRKRRQAAWDLGRDAAHNVWKNVRPTLDEKYTDAETVEFLRGLGQYFTGLAHDLTQQAQEKE